MCHPQDRVVQGMGRGVHLSAITAIGPGTMEGRNPGQRPELALTDAF